MKKVLYGVAAAIVLAAVALLVAVRAGAAPITSACVGPEPVGEFATYRTASRDGNCLQGYVWSAGSQARGVVVVVHGLGDHARRYRTLAGPLAEAGFATLAQDHRGHAGSGGARQRLDSVDQILGDIDLALAEARRRFPGLPIVLHGHSLGGMAVAQYASRRGADLAGVVVSSAALVLPPTTSGAQLRVVSLLSSVAPGLGLEAVDESKVVRDPAARAALAADPLIVRAKLPARTIATLLDGVADLQPRMTAIDRPVLILHGLADTVTEPSGSRLLRDRAASADKRLMLVEGALHDLLHEPEGPSVAREIVAFVSDVVGRRR